MSTVTPNEKCRELNHTVLDLMCDMKLLKDFPEYKSIIMNLTNISKDLNSIQIKLITGNGENTSEEDNSQQ
jgi:hypothetical protein